MRRMTLVLSLLALLSSPALPQEPAQPKDSAAKDSSSRPVGPGCELCIGVVIAAVNAGMLAAPSALLFFKTNEQDRGRLGFADAHVTAFFVQGGSIERPGKGWTHSENVEVRTGRLFGAMRIEHVALSDLGLFRFTTVRAGYVVHPRARIAGGFTLGYRWARGDTVQNAIEVSFPLFAGGPNGWGRFEPIYLISDAGVMWNYRLQAEFPIRRTPLLVGFNMEAKTVRQHGSYFFTPAVLVGFRF